jgi:predicted secreted protein
MTFPPKERALLLRTPGLGPTSVARLEDAGLGSMQVLRTLGAARVARIICERQGSHAWMNRRRALVSVLETACRQDASEPGGPG